jgi:hypothetical protein
MIISDPEKYRNFTVDITSPFAIEVLNLHKLYPNDSNFGEMVRKLVNNLEQQIEQKTIDKNANSDDRNVKWDL